METFYETRYNKKKPRISVQGCAAWMPIYETDAEGNFNDWRGAEIQEWYWK